MKAAPHGGRGREKKKAARGKGSMCVSSLLSIVLMSFIFLPSALAYAFKKTSGMPGQGDTGRRGGEGSAMVDDSPFRTPISISRRTPREGEREWRGNP
eukprot:2840759-Rhodomonas_salina.1